ncbi:hypothetical protein ACHWQZ_G011111 [Mnemiopsis leidyi]
MYKSFQQFRRSASARLKKDKKHVNQPVSTTTYQMVQAENGGGIVSTEVTMAPSFISSDRISVDMEMITPVCCYQTSPAHSYQHSPVTAVPGTPSPGHSYQHSSVTAGPGTPSPGHSYPHSPVPVGTPSPGHSYPHSPVTPSPGHSYPHSPDRSPASPSNTQFIATSEGCGYFRQEGSLPPTSLSSPTYPLYTDSLSNSNKRESCYPGNSLRPRTKSEHNPVFQQDARFTNYRTPARGRWSDTDQPLIQHLSPVYKQLHVENGPYPDFRAGSYVTGPMLSATQIADDFTTHLNLNNDSVDHVLYVDGPEDKSEEDERTITHVCKWGSKCNYQTTVMKNLVEHISSAHVQKEGWVGRNEFVCLWEGCSRKMKPFKAQYQITTHIRSHTGERPHSCTYEGCNRSYSRMENLKSHLRTHTGEKPYACPECNKTFNNASDRAKHRNRTHSRTKSYVCTKEGCDKQYTDPSSLRKHLISVHKEAAKKRQSDPGPLKARSRRSGLSTITHALNNHSFDNKDESSMPRKVRYSEPCGPNLASLYHNSGPKSPFAAAPIEEFKSYHGSHSGAPLDHAQVLSRLDIPEKHRHGLVMPQCSSVPAYQPDLPHCTQLSQMNTADTEMRRYTSEFVQRIDPWNEISTKTAVRKSSNCDFADVTHSTYTNLDDNPTNKTSLSAAALTVSETLDPYQFFQHTHSHNTVPAGTLISDLDPGSLQFNIWGAQLPTTAP